MDSHSRSASPRDPPRPQHRPPSPPTPTAFDNRGYQHDESDPNHNDSFNSNGPQQNGHSKEPNGDTKTLEAVNLELINLTPKNGSTKKKDVEVDMNATNPYDEYFVPVNEHKKYMRGEKLYVTADKRGEKGGCKRPLCWTLLGLVVAAIVALIVLAATGILFTNSPTPVEQYNVSSARAFGGIGHIHGHDPDHDHDHNEPPTEQHAPDTQNDQAHSGDMESEENGDSSMYVPRTVEGELKIDNERFVEALKDPESKEYKEFVANFNYALKWALFDRNTLERADNDIMVEIINLKNGSIIVTYRIHWKPKSDTESTDQLLTPKSLKTKLNNYLDRNNRILSVYHVAEDKMDTKPVLDLCQINKNDCEYGCEFDEISLDFICICPRGLIIDSQDPKKCIPLLETPVDTKENNYKVLTIESNPSTSKPTPEEEKPVSETVHAVGNDNYDWKETHHIMPETTTESETDLNFSHIFGHSGEHHDSETPKIESSQEHINPSPESEPTSEPEPNAEPEPVAEPKHEPELTVEHIPESNTEPKPEPTAEPEQVVESKPELESASQPEPSPEPKTSSEIDSSAEAQPATELPPTSIPTNVIIIDHHPIPESDSDSSMESAGELHPAAEPITTAPQPPEPLPTSEPKTGAELQPEPVPEPEPTTESQQSMKEDKYETKQQTDSMEIRPGIYDAEQKYDSESSDEQYNHTESTTVRISISEPNIINEPSYEPKPEIISILSDARKRMEDMAPETTTPEIIETSTDKEWLENDSDSEKNRDHTETENRNINDTLLYTDLLNHKENVHNVTEIEQRSFKTLEDVFIFHTTTEEPNKNNDEKSLDLTTKRNEILVTELAANAEEGNEVTTEREITTIPVFEMHNEVKSAEQPTKDISVEATTSTMINKEQGQESTSSEIFTNSANDTRKEEILKDEKSIIISVANDGNALTTNFNKTEQITRTTTEPEIITEYSISKQNNESEHDKDIIEALNKNKNPENKTSIEKTIHDEGAEITFDAINMLYNRSSKSMENEKSGVQDSMPTEENEDPNDTTQVTTESDWLSESVTEINYEEAMNKMGKHYETTESTIDKIDEIMSRGVTKDDFEPDYLNNMGTSNKMQELEVPIYGMVHDYDSDDSRVKRVNSESKETSTEPMMKDIVTETNANELLTEINSDSNLPIETTTVSEYIYKTAEKSSNESYVSSQSKNETMSVEITSSMSSHPAPVWEEETESEQDLSVKELPKIMSTNITAHDTDTIDEISVPMSTTTTLSTPMTIEKKIVSENSESFNNTDMSETSDSKTQNTTQLNNLNVTIYEISRHNGNHSFAAHKQNSHSAEYDDHETEMNPFLPEIEENKSLVKKLQEGHDIEPTNVNDTQNENIEEHNFNASEGRTIISNGTTTIIKEHENKLSTTTEDTLFNDLLMNVKPHQEESDENKDIVNDTVATDTLQEKNVEKPTIDNITRTDKSQDILPISTFLIDTDDLDKEHTTEHRTTMSKNNLENDVTSPPSVVTTVGLKAETVDTTEYLQVVPIMQERLEEKEALKKNNSENIQELNDISDSRKKSDRRTLDATKLESTS